LIIGRTLAAAIAFVALATAATSAVVAVAFALFFAFQPITGSAGAAGIVAAVFGSIVAIAALLALNWGSSEDRDVPEHEFSFVERIIEMSRTRPLLSAGAGIAALMIAFRNPALVATVAAAFMDRPKDRSGSRRRR
jgi:hypothetical protein